MQFLPRMKARSTPVSADFAREQSAGSRLPYLRHIDDHTIELHGGGLMQVIRLGGLMFETADTEQLDYRKSLRDAMLRALRSSRFALYHHIIRRRVQPERPGAFADDFSRRLDDAWQAKLASRQLYANELFLTLIRRPAKGQTGVAVRLGGLIGRAAAPRDAAAAQFAAERRALDAASDQLQVALAAYDPQRLGVYDADGGACAEILQFLAGLYNAEARPVRLPLGDLGEHIAYRRVSFGQDTAELGPCGTSPRAMAALVSIKDYPGETMPGMLDDLLRIPAEMVVSQSFAFVDRQQGLSRMNLALRRMRATDDEAVSLRGELSDAKDDMAAGRAAFGEHHLTVTIRGADQAEVDAGVAEVQATLSENGIISVREDLGLELAFWAQFPGNFKYIGRRALIGSANFAAFASGHNFPVGRADGNLWGDAVTVFETTAAGPYHFSFHHGDLGNFTLIGPSGSGKTVMVNFLLAQARRFNPRIVFFDKDRGA